MRRAKRIELDGKGPFSKLNPSMLPPQSPSLIERFRKDEEERLAKIVHDPKSGEKGKGR